MTRALGPLQTEWPLKRAARDIVWAYTGIYADEIVRQQTPAGEPVERVERLRDVIIRERAIRLPEEQMPAILLAVPGTAKVVYRSGNGLYAAVYQLEVHSAVQATDAEVGGEIASVLALAATKALLEGLPGQLDGRVGGVSWEGGGSNEYPGDDADRSRHTAVHVLNVVLNDVLSDRCPLPEDLSDPPLGDPPADPGELPVIEETDLTTTTVEEIDP